MLRGAFHGDLAWTSTSTLLFLYCYVIKKTRFLQLQSCCFSAFEWVRLRYWALCIAEPPGRHEQRHKGQGWLPFSKCCSYPGPSADVDQCLVFTALHPWNDWANKDSSYCQSQTISKEIPSVATSLTSNTHMHTQHRAEWKEMERVGGGAPELTEWWEKP